MAETAPNARDPAIEARITLLRRASAQFRGTPGLAYDLAETLIQNGQVEDGVRAYRQAVAIEPQLRPASITVPPERRALVAASTARLSQALLDHGVAVSAVLLGRAWSAALQGDKRCVEKLLDTRRFLHVEERAFPDLLDPEFRARIVAEIEGAMTAHRLPWSAIRQARRDSAVLDRTRDCGNRLAARLREAVDAYIARLGEADHPFVAARPDGYRLDGWCVTFHGGSRHISHIHPAAWLSGVIYLQTDGISADDPEHRGWLRVGPPEGIDVATGWQEHWIEPKAATLVLFPSYFTHETMPMRGEAKRICVAFDVVPCATSQ